MNRLKLDFSLETDSERIQFINTYLTPDFNPTNSELEKIADYLLWGKNTEGLSSNKTSNIELKTAWSAHPIISLDELRESPAFNEDSVKPINSTPIKTSKQKFSREAARKNAPPHILALLEGLWREIDTIDLTISLYEVQTQKKSEIRPELLERFSSDEISTLTKKAQTINQYTYLKLKRHLIEKRREQFTLQDYYQTKIQRFIPHVYNSLDTPILDADLPVYPLGLIGASELSKALFPDGRFPLPSDFKTEKLQRSLTSKIWEPRTQGRSFDFGDLKHLQGLMKIWDSLNEELDSLPLESTLRGLFKTFEWYKDRAQLTTLENEVFQLKMARNQNQTIADHINKKYQKTYNSNYISTIFHQKVLAKIQGAALLHQKYAENIFFPENFKKCKDCGETLLLDTEFFMRRKSSKDGFSCRCKKCDRILRYQRANKELPV